MAAMSLKRYVLTISCQDIKGIVAAVSGFLTKHDGFILESAQFGDPSTGIFFMRALFEIPLLDPLELAEAFTPIAQHFAMRWELHDVMKKPKVIIMVSKLGHCYNDLLHRYFTGSLPMEIVAVISNHRDMEEITQWYQLPYYYFPITPQNKAEQEEKLWNIFTENQADLVILARYMQVLTPELTAKLRGKAINIHHSFLPSFKGAKPYHQAYDRGVKLIGATAHYVNENLDEGPIIEQEVIRVDHTHTAEQLVALGKDIESLVLARAVKYHLEQRVLLNETKTVIFK